MLNFTSYALGRLSLGFLHPCVPDITTAADWAAYYVERPTGRKSAVLSYRSFFGVSGPLGFQVEAVRKTFAGHERTVIA